MNSTESWWDAQIDWETPAGVLLKKFIELLPSHRHYHLIIYGSAPLQMTLDPSLLSGDVDLFAESDEDLSPIIRGHQLMPHVVLRVPSSGRD
jgi:hypothetical protein